MINFYVFIVQALNFSDCWIGELYSTVYIATAKLLFITNVPVVYQCVSRPTIATSIQSTKYITQYPKCARKKTQLMLTYISSLADKVFMLLTTKKTHTGHARILFFNYKQINENHICASLSCKKYVIIIQYLVILHVFSTMEDLYPDFF